MPKVVQVLFEGRFGNNLFQYAMGRALAEIWGAELQTPPWVGQEIFEDAGSAPLKLCTTPPHIITSIRSLPPFDLDDEVVVLEGFWQATKFLKLYSLQQVRKWFKLKPEFDTEVDGDPYLAFHIRRGDMSENSNEWATVSEGSYARAIEKFGFQHMARVFVSEEHPRIIEKLPSHLSFLADWRVLQQARVLFRANSSFSWWAGELGRAKQVFSPRVRGNYGLVEVEFEPGNHCAFTSGEHEPDVNLMNISPWWNGWVGQENDGGWYIYEPSGGSENAEGPFKTRGEAVLRLCARQESYD